MKFPLVLRRTYDAKVAELVAEIVYLNRMHEMQSDSLVTAFERLGKYEPQFRSREKVGA